MTRMPPRSESEVSFRVFSGLLFVLDKALPTHLGVHAMAYILAADENALVVDLMSIFLSEDGHRFLSASGLAELTSILESGDDPPDLLILSADLEPGFLAELIFELRGLVGMAAPVLVTLPSGAAEVPSEVQGIPGVDVLHKPFDSETFMAQVRRLLSPQREAPQAEEDSEAAEFEPSETDVDSTMGTGTLGNLEGLQLGELATAALNEQIRIWLAEEGRLIMEHEARKALQETYDKVVQDVVWKVVPEMAEEMLRAEIRKLTEELEN